MHDAKHSISAVSKSLAALTAKREYHAAKMPDFGLHFLVVHNSIPQKCGPAESRRERLGQAWRAHRAHGPRYEQRSCSFGVASRTRSRRGSAKAGEAQTTVV